MSAPSRVASSLDHTDLTAQATKRHKFSQSAHIWLDRLVWHTSSARRERERRKEA